VVTAFAYWASEAVGRYAATCRDVAAIGSLVGASEDADFSWLAGFATVIWTRDSALLTPTRPTAAAPMAAIDSATVSQPTASPAT
jgi:hypothetical protein